MSRASFDAEWFDRFASVMKKYTIGYYEADGTVEARAVTVGDSFVLQILMWQCEHIMRASCVIFDEYLFCVMSGRCIAAQQAWPLSSAGRFRAIAAPLAHFGVILGVFQFGKCRNRNVIPISC